MEERERFNPEADEARKGETEEDVEAHARRQGHREQAADAPSEPGAEDDDVEAHGHRWGHRESHDV